MIPEVLLVVGLFALGLLVGPLLGVVADRAVERERLEPDHRCQACGSSLGGVAALVPITNWRLRCPEDGSHPRWRYPLIDVAAAVCFAAAGWRFGWSWQLGPYLLFFAALVVMAVIDVETHLLLNVLTWPALFVGLFLVLLLSGPNGHEEGIWAAIAGAVFFGGFLFVMHRIYPPGLGLGDVKMALSLGLFLGWMGSSPLEAVVLSVWTLMIASFALAAFGLGRRVLQGVNAEVPMGPALAAATVVVVMVPGVFVSTL